MKAIFNFLYFLLVSLTTHSIIAQTNEKPNIIFILADDFGYGSLNSYGASEKLVRTPNIDRIADGGMRFTNAHTTASVCSPTRYGFLMGRYPWRTERKYGTVAPDGKLLPDPERTTIADILKDKGYATASIGKWHLGYGNTKPCDFTGKLSPGPLDLGFDYHFGIPQNHGDYWGVYVENEEIYGLRTKKVNQYSRTYYGKPYLGFDAPQRVNKDAMKDLTDKSVQWIKQQSAVKPFFLYFAAVAVHHPITPSDYMRGLSDCGPYGDFIQDLDLSVGRIVETLEYMGLAENTIIIFSSDNGGEIPPNNPNAPENTAIKYGLKINGDLRGDKHTIYEGGTNVPFILKWKGFVEEGTTSDDLVNILDLFATVAEITGTKLSESKEIAPDSYSFLPSLLKQDNKNPRKTMITADAKGMLAIRVGNWKLIDNTPPPGFPENSMTQYKDEKRQLYNLANDPSEKVNLFEQNPEKAKQMLNELRRMQKSSSTR